MKVLRCISSEVRSYPRDVIDRHASRVRKRRPVRVHAIRLGRALFVQLVHDIARVLINRAHVTRAILDPGLDVLEMV